MLLSLRAPLRAYLEGLGDGARLWEPSCDILLTTHMSCLCNARLTELHPIFWILYCYYICVVLGLTAVGDRGHC